MLKSTQNNTFRYEFVLMLLCRQGLKKLATVSEDVLFHRFHFRASGERPVKIKKSPADKLLFPGPKVNNHYLKFMVGYNQEWAHYKYVRAQARQLAPGWE